MVFADMLADDEVRLIPCFFAPVNLLLAIFTPFDLSRIITF